MSISDTPIQNHKAWWIYRGDGRPDCQRIFSRPDPPAWRRFGVAGQDAAETAADDARAGSATEAHHVDGQLGQAAVNRNRGQTFIADDEEREMVNAALYLRRPLLVTGKPGTGKSSLAYAVAHELCLGQVLVWPINTRSALQDALYRYDAIGRLQAANFDDSPPEIGDYIQLGPLGSALLPARRPRVLLIDEIDKSDIDLPNDLLNIFEEGEYEIPELARLAHSTGEGNRQSRTHAVTVRTVDGGYTTIVNGRVRCNEFPFVVITSNGERELPAPFMRRCLRLDIAVPNPKKLEDIVHAHFAGQNFAEPEKLIGEFLERRSAAGNLATDQLLNAIYLANAIAGTTGEDSLEHGGISKDSLIQALMRPLDSQA